MRTLPADQNGELVVRVVRATLASLNVLLPDIIEDATRKQKATQEKIAEIHAKVTELDKQLEAHRAEIAAAEADLKETTEVKERLQRAEAASGWSPSTAGAGNRAAVTTLLGTATHDEPAAPKT
jgi:peptidoglycan hydrolase CwlO-like protein